MQRGVSGQREKIRAVDSNRHHHETLRWLVNREECDKGGRGGSGTNRTEARVPSVCWRKGLSGGGERKNCDTTRKGIGLGSP